MRIRPPVGSRPRHRGLAAVLLRPRPGGPGARAWPPDRLVPGARLPVPLVPPGPRPSPSAIVRPPVRRAARLTWSFTLLIMAMYGVRLDLPVRTAASRRAAELATHLDAALIGLRAGPVRDAQVASRRIQGVRTLSVRVTMTVRAAGPVPALELAQTALLTAIGDRAAAWDLARMAVAAHPAAVLLGRGWRRGHGRRIRVSAAVLTAGPVTCGVCRPAFESLGAETASAPPGRRLCGL
jgi:hypothetical protein